MKLKIRESFKTKIFIVLSLTVLMVLSIVSINAATKSKNHSWTTNYGGATETVKLTVDLSTINKPSVSYTKNGYGGYYNGASYAYAGISNSLTKKISGDTATYTNKATPSWTNKVSYSSVKGGTKTAKFKYTGSLTVN